MCLLLILDLGFRVKDDTPVKHVVDNRKYGTVGRKPREHAQPSYHALPRSSYMVQLPPDRGHHSNIDNSDNTPDLLQDHDLTGGERSYWLIVLMF